MAYKNSTQTTLDYIEKIENHLKSESYKSQIGGQDIITQSSSYKYNNEQTLGESIEIMRIGFQKIKDNISLYDQGNIDYKNNINNTCINNILAWLESSPISNWQNIIQNINNFIMYLGYIGIFIASEGGKNKDYKLFNRRLSQAEDFVSKVTQAETLYKKLKPISEAIPSLESIQNAKTNSDEIIRLHENIKELEQSATESKRNIEENAKYAGIMLGKITTDVVGKYFQKLADEYKKSVEGDWTTELLDITNKDGTTSRTWKLWKWKYGFMKGFFNWNTYYFVALSLVAFSLYFILFYSQSIDCKTNPLSGSGLILQNINDCKKKVEIGLAVNNYDKTFIKDVGAENINGGMIALEIVKIISNGIIRLVLLMPSLLLLWFVMQNRNDKNRLRKTYEFRETTINTLPGQLEQLRQQGIPSEKIGDFLAGTLTQIYSEPLDEKKESGEGLITNLKDTADIMQKWKDIFKS
ncbi:MAG: hypothetical protein HHAS10_05300 [Candidatus Altimarinota bacterium]